MRSRLYLKRALDAWRDARAAHALRYQRAQNRARLSAMQICWTAMRAQWMNACQTRWLRMRAVFMRWRRAAASASRAASLDVLSVSSSSSSLSLSSLSSSSLLSSSSSSSFLSSLSADGKNDEERTHRVVVACARLVFPWYDHFLPHTQYIFDFYFYFCFWTGFIMNFLLELIIYFHFQMSAGSSDPLDFPPPLRFPLCCHL